MGDSRWCRLWSAPKAAAARIDSRSEGIGRRSAIRRRKTAALWGRHSRSQNASAGRGLFTAERSMVAMGVPGFRKRAAGCDRKGARRRGTDGKVQRFLGEAGPCISTECSRATGIQHWLDFDRRAGDAPGPNAPRDFEYGNDALRSVIARRMLSIFSVYSPARNVRAGKGTDRRGAKDAPWIGRPQNAGEWGCAHVRSTGIGGA